MTIRSVSDAIAVMEALKARGTIREVDYSRLHVRVQRWKMGTVRYGLEHVAPVGVKIRVESLSLWEHFTHWDIRQLQ